MECCLHDKSINHNNLKMILKLIGEISEILNFNYDEDFGYVGPLPKFFGTGININIGFNLNNNTILSNNEDVSQILNKYRYLKIDKNEVNSNFTLTANNLIYSNEARQIKETIDLINEIVIFDNNYKGIKISDTGNLNKDKKTEIQQWCTKNKRKKK